MTLDPCVEAARIEYAMHGNEMNLTAIAKRANVPRTTAQYRLGKMGRLADFLAELALQDPDDKTNRQIILKHYVNHREQKVISPSRFLAAAALEVME